MEQPETHRDPKLDELVRCHYCQGEGQVYSWGRFDSGHIECPACQGTGRMPRRLHLEFGKQQEDTAQQEARRWSSRFQRSLRGLGIALTKWWEDGPR
jgi:hypothetical protein